MRDQEYRPSIGSNQSGFDRSPLSRSPVQTYADLDKLNSKLDELNELLDTIMREFEEDLSEYDLIIDTNADSRLAEAHLIEWPSALGVAPESIPYSYYKTLRLRNTASARYIRRRYEEAVRDVAGTLSLDLLILADLIRNEVYLIQDFVSSTIQDVDDSSEFRTLEVLQDWVQSSIRYASSFRSLFSRKDERVIPVSQVNRTAASEAREGQAVSKVKLNNYNKRISQELESIRRSFGEFSEVFYNKHLKPSIDYRLKSGRKLRSGVNQIEQEIDSTSRVLAETISITLADEVRRKAVLEEKLDKLVVYVESQNRARNAIKELAPKGKPIPADGARVLSATGVNHEYSETMLNQHISESPASSTLASSHSALGGLHSDDHPQYLLRSGGTVDGNIYLSDGGRIDGIVPSQHRHTGSDGSPQINGADIIGGTLSEDAVDPEVKPPRPEDLTFVKYTGSVNSGLVEATMSWYGDSRYSYEIQLARLEGADYSE